ncbi:DUF7529 family protein [Natronomonas amylolytica]|uniref:DUF7529 family protein n=1 Tax=Natronomonas amylolytica TaxID=3108498 RepID=UPI00300A83A1
MDPNPDPNDKPTGVRPQSPPEQQAWQATLDDMEAIEAERREDGWDVTSMFAIHVNPKNRDVGDDDRFGLSFVIPDNKADAFEDAYERGEFPEYLVYRREVKQSTFIVTEYIDPESGTIILVAGRYDSRYAAGMVQSALDEGEFYTYVQTIDGTDLGEFYHEDLEAFVGTDEDTDPEDD